MWKPFLHIIMTVRYINALFNVPTVHQVPFLCLYVLITGFLKTPGLSRIQYLFTYHLIPRTDTTMWYRDTFRRFVVLNPPDLSLRHICLQSANISTCLIHPIYPKAVRYTSWDPVFRSFLTNDIFLGIFSQTQLCILRWAIENWCFLISHGYWDECGYNLA